MAQDGMDFERNGEVLPPKLHTRPEPTRTQPIRNWNGIFAAPGKAAAAEPEPAAPSAEPARQGVAAGYRVIDEYLRQGRKAARDFWSPAAADAQADGAASEPSTPGGDNAAPRAPDISKLSERWLRSLGEFGTNWLELMQAMSRQDAPRGGQDDDETSAGPFAVGNAASAATSTAPKPHAKARPAAPGVPRMAFAISSAKPVEVQVNLEPAAWEAELEVAPLGDLRGDLPPIRGVKASVSIDSVTGERCLKLEASISADQPSGSYHGVVLVQGQPRPVGTLTFCVG